MDEELRTAVSKLYSEYWHSDISGQQFQQKIIDLFQAREQQLLTELLGELPLQYDNYTGTDMEDYQNGHNAAINQAVSVIKSKIGELNG